MTARKIQTVADIKAGRPPRMAQTYDADCIKKSYNRYWLTKRLKLIDPALPLAQQQRLARSYCNVDLRTHFNKQIPKHIRYRLQPKDLTLFLPDASDTAEQILHAYTRHVGRIYSKVKREIKKEAQAIAQATGTELNIVTLEAVEQYQDELASRTIAYSKQILPNGKLLSEVTQSKAGKHAELFAQVKGISQLMVEDYGCFPFFITMTAPSKFHPQGGENKEWRANGMPDAKEAKHWLDIKWQAFQSKLRHLKIDTVGMKVIEAHADGCPHAHALIFVPPLFKDAFYEIFNEVFPCDASNKISSIEAGSDMLAPASYLIKTIIRSEDSEATQAWRAMNKFRAYSFFGISGFGGLWKWSFSMGAKSANASVNVARGSGCAASLPDKFDHLSESVLGQMSRAAFSGDGLAFFRLYQQVGKLLTRAEGVKSTQRDVFDAGGNSMEVIHVDVPVGVLAYSAPDFSLLGIGRSPLKIGSPELHIILQAISSSKTTDTGQPYNVAIRTPSVSIFRPPTWEVCSAYIEARAVKAAELEAIAIAKMNLAEAIRNCEDEANIEWEESCEAYDEMETLRDFDEFYDELLGSPPRVSAQIKFSQRPESEYSEKRIEAILKVEAAKAELQRLIDAPKIAAREEKKFKQDLRLFEEWHDCGKFEAALDLMDSYRCHPQASRFDILWKQLTEGWALDY